ncbi:MAG: Sec-independent protein translocase protein TatB [Gammaproteobacteria bacterium]
MFEIGFWELVLIMVIALLVLGPERLPEVARTVGRWVGKARGMMHNVKAEIDRELAADELQRLLSKQAESHDPFEMIEKVATPKAPVSAPETSTETATPSRDQTAHDGKP